MRFREALLGEFGHSFSTQGRSGVSADFHRAVTVKQVTGILSLGPNYINRIENQCCSALLHCTNRRQDAALAFSLCASRVIVMWDSPSASSSLRIEVA